jgi:hypothetical protein
MTAGAAGAVVTAVHMAPWRSGAPTVCGSDEFPRAVNGYREHVTCVDCLSACDEIPAVDAWDELTRGFWQGGRRVTAGELRPGQTFRWTTYAGYVVARVESVPAWIHTRTGEEIWPASVTVHCRGRRRRDGSRCGSSLLLSPETYLEVTR